MNRDRIEPALRQPGPREQGYQHVAFPASATDARRPQGARGRLLAAVQVGMLAAAVVAGAAIAVMLTRGTGPAPGSHELGTGSPTPSAAASLAPTPSAAASLAPTAPAACHAEEFAWSTDPWTGAAGSRGTNVLARGVTSLAGCEIRGRATLVLRDAGGHSLLSTESAVSAVSVHAGTLLEIGISWSNWCDSDPIGPLSLSLTLPGDTQEVPLVASTGQILVPPCLGQGQASILNATEFQLSDRTPPQG